MNCLKNLSERHDMCLITSIHQMNNGLLMMFDKVLVLSRSGQCIYSGEPRQIRTYLADHNAHITERQLPIEALLKYCCHDSDDSIIKTMIDSSSQKELNVIDVRVKDETDLSINGIEQLAKRFFWRDLNILLLRRANSLLHYEWRVLAFQLAVYLTFAIVMIWIYNYDIGSPSGCLSIDEDFNNTCVKTVTKLREEELLAYNIYYNHNILLILMLLSIIMPTLTFSADLTLFFNEHRNCE